jgi:hypothetical protein
MAGRNDGASAPPKAIQRASGKLWEVWYNEQVEFGRVIVSETEVLNLIANMAWRR